MDSDEIPRINGFVIITLPPIDNPSLGKTISAFTLTDDYSQTHQTQQQQQSSSEEQNPLPSQTPPQNPQLQFSFSTLFPGFPRKFMAFLGVSLFALVLCSSLFSHTLQELRNSNDDQEEDKKSFIFPLYHKIGFREVSQRDVEFKLGMFVDLDMENMVDDQLMRPHQSKINSKLISANSVAVAGDSSPVFPVRGNVYPDGLYFTYIRVGNPPRPYHLDIDTGSDLTWIQCDAPCTSCAKGANPLYKPRKVNILPFKDSLCVEIQGNQKAGYCETCQQCDYEIEYADRSSSMGVLARDELHLMISNGSLSKSNVVFGCAYDQQGLLLNTMVKTDGILGLSRAKVSLPSQLASQGIINNVVGHCLPADAGDGGYMFLGDEFVPNWGMAWVPMLGSSSKEFYRAEIVKMNYGSSPLSLGSRVGRVLFDTGSSYTYFTKQAYSELISALKEVSAMGLIQDASDPTLPICWRAKFPIRSVIDVKQYFKTLTLQFGSQWWIVSKKLRIPPEGYLIISTKGNICLGILDGSGVHDGSTIILGDISLRGQLVVYDNVNKKIGWAKSDCVKPKRFNSLPFF